MTAVLWVPVRGDQIEFRSGRDVPYRLLALDGLGPVPIGPITRKSPSQIGETAVDVAVPGRVVTLQAFVQAVSLEALWPVRAALSRALVTEPVSISSVGPYDLGRLRITERTGSPDLELSAVPRSTSLPAPKSSVGIVPCDIEFYAPQPWWSSLYDSQLVLGAAGAAGLQWPVNFPIQFASNNVVQDAINEGDVRAPITARIYGDVTNPKLTNVTTGEAIEVLMNVPSGSYLEISTEFGDKRIELVTGSTRTNAMDSLNLAIADFWQLLAGVNTIRFEATINTSGSCLLLWRSRYSGI